MKAFNAIINYLSTKGKAYLARIPTPENLTAIENKKYPHFSKLVEDMARQQDVRFFDFSLVADSIIASRRD